MNRNSYRVFYSIVYGNLIILDTLRLSFFKKSDDTAFFGIVALLSAIFGLDIILSSFVKHSKVLKKEGGQEDSRRNGETYFLSFYFWVDLMSILTILLTATATTISLYIFYSFLKTVMIIRVSRIIVALKMHRRKRMVEDFIKKS